MPATDAPYLFFGKSSTATTGEQDGSADQEGASKMKRATAQVGMRVIPEEKP